MGEYLLIFTKGVLQLLSYDPKWRHLVTLSPTVRVPVAPYIPQ